MEYIDLHIHTNYTKGNSVTDVSELVKRAKEYKMSALGITDSGTIDGFSEFILNCKKYNIKPILGCGFYFAPMGHLFKETEHLVLIAKDFIGYQNLVNLSNYSFNEGYGIKPRIDFTVLKKFNESLICLSGGLGGVFDKPFINGNGTLAKENLEELKEIFNENLYLEIQDNGLELNRLIMPEIIKISEKLDISVVVTGGSFYLNSSDAQDCNSIREKNNNKILEGNGYYFKSPQEIKLLFSDYTFAIQNSVKISEQISEYDI